MWWQVSRSDGRLRVHPRWVTRSHLPDVLPEVLWRRGATLLGDRLHFCVGHLEGTLRTIEWKSNDWLVGRREYTGPHTEREPNRYDDSDSYE